MNKKNKYLTELKKSLKDEEFQQGSGATNSIFYNEEVGYIFGDFCDGIRGLDHNSLIFDGFTFEDVANFGAVIVPEERTYIATKKYANLESEGFKLVYN